MADGNPRVVLVADDDASLRLLCRVNLEYEGYRVLEASSAAEVEHVIDGEEVTLVLLDVHLGQDDGVAVARELREKRPEVRIAFFTGSASELPDEARRLVDGTLPKPFILEELSATVRRLAPA